MSLVLDMYIFVWHVESVWNFSMFSYLTKRRHLNQTPTNFFFFHVKIIKRKKVRSLPRNPCGFSWWAYLQNLRELPLIPIVPLSTFARVSVQIK